MPLNEPSASRGPQVNLTLGAVAVATVAGILILAALPSWVARHRARKLCQEWTELVLREAKQAKPEVGVYEAELPASDPWGAPLHSTLIVDELANTVIVVSGAKDTFVGTDDDISARKTDIHVRKTIGKGIEAGARHFGKGLAKGVIEGVGEGTEEEIEKVKEGVKKSKNKLMDRFRKKTKETVIERDAES